MEMGFFNVERPGNEPCRQYTDGSPERRILSEAVEIQAAQTVEIPCIIGGKEVFTGTTADVTEPHRRTNVIAHLHLAGEKELEQAADAALKAKRQWEDIPWDHRAMIFMKAADLLSGPWRTKVLAATMLGQSKNMWEAEIDIAELCDFLRFNAYNLRELYRMQPGITAGANNRIEYRPLEGFVAALSPFNFTSIGGNLPCAPAQAGNVVVWKPSTAAALSNYFFMQILLEAGLPEGVINFVPSRGADFSRCIVSHPDMAGFHFTGSTGVFNSVWQEVGTNIERYRSYPRIVGETGGKDFIFLHPTADTEAAVCGIIKGAFGYAGQKCSAASRVYLPASLWPEIRDRLKEAMKGIYAGDIRDPKSYCNAVIDRRAYERIRGYIDDATASDEAEIFAGGKYDDSAGYFIQPTVILSHNPEYRSMVEEIFGPVVTLYVYEDDKLDDTLKLCDSSTNYALSGAIYCRDRYEILRMEKALEHAAGNFYINEKPTGAVVGQQPFGGSRASGTNDKAGSITNMLRWISQRTIKEVHVPETEYRLPHMM